MTNVKVNRICDNCKFSKGYWCNRLVSPGGMGRHDRVAKDFLKNNECKYFEFGEVVCETKPNFENS